MIFKQSNKEQLFKDFLFLLPHKVYSVYPPPPWYYPNALFNDYIVAPLSDVMGL